jgi:nucleotide-binding universal stress UspA family protein
VEGEPAAQIIEHARRVSADIIVLGHAHHGRLDQVTGGSVAGRVLEHAPCAVLMPPVRRAHAT